MLKSLPKRKTTWLNYLDKLKDNPGQELKMQLIQFQGFFRINRFANSFFKHCTPFVYLLDYRRSEYIRMSESFAGYPSKAFVNGGIGHMLDIYHPDHLKLFDEDIFPERLRILSAISAADHSNYLFTYNLCLRNEKGKYENFLQRNCFFSDSLGNPLLSMGILTPLNDHRVGTRIVQTVDRISMNGLVEQRVIDRAVFHLNDEDKLFSKREKEILQWMADGFSSKMIAGKLHISEHTVNNHRRSMQDKSNMPNAIALVSFAIRKEII